MHVQYIQVISIPRPDALKIRTVKYNSQKAQTLWFNYFKNK